MKIGMVLDVQKRHFWKNPGCTVQTAVVYERAPTISSHAARMLAVASTMLRTRTIVTTM